MKKILLSIVFLLFFFSSAGYSAQYNSQPKKLIVLLDWFANPDHAPLFVAQQQGYFKQQGLEVELIGPADPSDPPKLVAAQKADIAVTYQPQFMEQVDKGLPLIRIGTLIDKPLTCLAILKESPIHTVHDLKGKRIGYSGDVSNMILKVMLEKNHLSLNDVELINVHYDLTQALLSKKIDAVTGMMRNFELTQLELWGHPARAFYPEQHGVPSYSELIFVAHKEKIQDPRFVSFLTAVKQGVQYLQKHPQETWVQFAKTHPALNDELNKRAWFATIPYFSKNPPSFDAASWLAFGHYLRQNDLVSKVQPITMYAIDLTKEAPK